MNILSETETVRLNEIMNQFDFNKVHKCMKLMDWKWGIFSKESAPNITYNVPTLENIKNSAKDLITTVIISYLRTKTSGFTGTGGLEIFYNHQQDYIEIKFVLTEWIDDYILEEDVYKKALIKENRKKTIKTLLDDAGKQY